MSFGRTLPIRCELIGNNEHRRMMAVEKTSCIMMMQTARFHGYVLCVCICVRERESVCVCVSQKIEMIAFNDVAFENVFEY